MPLMTSVTGRIGVKDAVPNKSGWLPKSPESPQGLVIVCDPELNFCVQNKMPPSILFSVK